MESFNPFTIYLIFITVLNMFFFYKIYYETIYTFFTYTITKYSLKLS